MNKKIGVFWDFWGVWEHQRGLKSKFPKYHGYDEYMTESLQNIILFLLSFSTFLSI
jgi:hypothetical protein